MTIGLIVFSQTGNTLSVALKLQEKLTQAGQAVTMERVEITGELGPNAQDFQLKTKPEVAPYDTLIFAAPVMGFSLNPAMKQYLKQIAPLEGKEVALLVTEFFPFPWMGGNQAVRQMKRICESKGGTIRGSGIVNWSNRRREQQIVEVTDRLSRAFR